MKYLPWALLALLVAGWLRRDHSQTVELQAARQEFSALQKRMLTADTIYVRDTVRLTRVRTRYDTLMVNVRTTDTVWVKKFIQVADSTVDACFEALNSCGARLAIRDSMLFSLQRQVKILERKSSVWSKLPWVLGGVVMGMVLK